jgi:PAS domain S-box-containing protein
MSNSSLAKIVILIVDDSEVDRYTYIRYLQAETNRDYDFLEADTLASGLELWRSHQPDIILIDYALPDGDGLDLLTEIGAENLVSQTKAIMLTGMGDEKLAVQAMKMGAADYLNKSDLSASALRNRVWQVYDRLILSRQLQRSQQQQIVIAEIALRIRKYFKLNDILDAIVDEIRTFLNTDRTSIYQFNPDLSGAIVAESLVPPWSSSIDIQISDECFSKNKGGEYREGRIFNAPDIYAANLSECHLKLLERLHIRASLIVPILIPDGKTTYLWGLLITYQCSAPRQWEKSDIELLQQLSVQLAIAIQQAALYQNFELANATLEIRVADRTTELYKRQNALQESNRRWQSLLNNVRLIVVGLDNKGIVEYVNSFFLEVTEYKLEEVIGKEWNSNFIPQAEQESTAQAFSNNFYPYYQNSIVTKTGEELMIAWNNTMLQNESGKQIGTISIGEDITEKLKIDRVKSEFISIVSHELRTPLASIRGALGLLASGVLANKPDTSKQMLNIAAFDIERLARLVNEILNLERLESNQNILERKWGNTSDLCEQAISSLQALTSESQIQLVYNSPPYQIFADRDRLVQTLVNLLSNAIKFSPPHTQVSLEVEESADEIIFHVRDRGRGIPANYLESIFERFNQVDASDSRQKGGTGLGLAICRTIIQQHGGKIWVESELTKGSIFSFSISNRFC